jgi:transposase-like protein
MSAELCVCPVCTEFETTPVPIKKSPRLGNKYRCKICETEFWLKVTKEPAYKNLVKKH